MRRALSFMFIGLAALIACSSAELKISPGGSSGTDPKAPDTEETEEEGGAVDAGADVVVKATATDSGCPKATPITPANVPAGFLKAVKVTLDHMADGDSGDFNFPTVKKQGVRSLWINTEESFGDAGTELGLIVKASVKTIFQTATDIQIAVQETSPGSGLPKEDPYDRWLSLIFVNGELYQTRAIREGFSAYYTLFGCAPAPVHEALLYAEAEANAADRGIWGPMPPKHNDYQPILAQWIHNPICRPNPFKGQPYCAK